MLSFRVFVKRIYRSPAAPWLSRFPFPPLSPKSHGINLFADHHPLTPITSIFYKNSAGRGYSRRSDIRKLQRADVLCPVKSFPCQTSENSPVSPTIATDPKTHLSKFCICDTSETPRGGKPPVTSHYHSQATGLPRPCRGHLFVEFITCPEGVHRTYYWSRRVVSPTYPRSQFRRFRMRFIAMGGCDG